MRLIEDRGHLPVGDRAKGVLVKEDLFLPKIAAHIQETWEVAVSGRPPPWGRLRHVVTRLPSIPAALLLLRLLLLLPVHIAFSMHS